MVEDYSENKPTIGVDEPPESGEQNGFTRQTADKTANMAANIPALTGHDLLAAIHQAEIDPAAPAEFSEDQEIHLEGRAIPLIPRLLSAPEIETLMQSEAYRTWYHPASEKVRDTVSEWFAITYPGPLNVDSHDPDGNAKWVEKLTPAGVRTIDRAGGTMLHTSRTNPGRVAPDDVPAFLDGRFTPDAKTGTTDCTAHVEEALSWLGIDCLIPIGGDDTLSYAARLAKEGVRVVAIPKTMDNDVFGTDYCIGFSTAVTRSVEFIQALRTPAGSHERIAVIELFGRHSGETALIAGYLAGADRTLISEVPVDIDRLAKLVRQDRIDNPSHYAVVVVSEGATIDGGTRVEGGEADAYGHLKLGGIGQVIGAALKARTGVEIINQSLGYLMRAGAPDSLDRMVAVTFGHLALEQIADGAGGVMVAGQGVTHQDGIGSILVQFAIGLVHQVVPGQGAATDQGDRLVETLFLWLYQTD